MPCKNPAAKVKSYFLTNYEDTILFGTYARMSARGSEIKFYPQKTSYFQLACAKCHTRRWLVAEKSVHLWRKFFITNSTFMDALTSLFDIFLHLDKHLGEFINAYGATTMQFFSLVVLPEQAWLSCPSYPATPTFAVEHCCRHWRYGSLGCFVVLLSDCGNSW